MRLVSLNLFSVTEALFVGFNRRGSAENLWISPDIGSAISQISRISYSVVVFFARIAEIGDIPRGNNLGFKGRPDAVLNEPAHHP